MNSREVEKYHATRTSIDAKFIDSVFERDERELLARLQMKYPGKIIHMPNCDLIAPGFIKGIGGSVPWEVTNT
jgi:hypothetical protein